MTTHYPRRPDDRRWAKARAVVGRRLPAFIAALLVLAAAYVALGLRDEVTYDAEAVFYVPANVAGQQPPGDQDAAVKLAKTYATALPLNAQLLAGAAQRSHEPVTYVGSHLGLTNDAGTSVLRVQYAGSTPAATAAVLGFFSRSLTATKPPNPVGPGSVKIINLPREAVATGRSLKDRVPLGVALGVAAGLALAYLLEVVRPRIDTVQECRSALGVPVVWWGGGADQRLWSWARRGGSPRVELVPADRKAGRVTPIVEEELGHALHAATGPAAPRPQTNGAAVPAPVVTVRAVHADHDDAQDVYTVLVLRRGALKATAQGAAETLSLQSRLPSGAVLAGSPRSFQVFRPWPAEPDQ